MLALAKIHPNIVGMKDTVAGMDHTRELIKVVKSHIPQFEIYSGFDDNFAHNVLSGGDGCIGALSNVVPEICAAWSAPSGRTTWPASPEASRPSTV